MKILLLLGLLVLGSPGLLQAQEAPFRDVDLGIYLIDIEEINSRTQSFVANVVLNARWQDDSLAHDGALAIRRPLREVWHPGLQILNQQRLVKTFPDEVEISPEGEVTHLQRYWGGFSQPMELRAFPFDSQTLSVLVVSANTLGLQPRFSVTDDSGLAEQLKIPDWDLQDWQAESFSLPLGRDKKLIPAVEMSVTLDRAISFFTLKVIFPLILIVAMSWLVFWLDPTLVASKISVVVTAMLTLIAYRFAVGGMVPRLSFLTSLDYFVLASSVLVFLTLVQVARAAWLVEKEQVEKARSLDRTARWLAPLVYAVMLSETLWLRLGIG